MQYPRISKSKPDTVIVTETVTMKWCSMTKAHYQNMGYKYTHIGDEFVCDVRHLTKRSNARVVVKCPICNRERYVVYNDLTKSGHSFCGSCGKIKDIHGEVFGRWLVISLDQNTTVYGEKSHWLCQCECGEIRSVSANSLIMGKSTSCGCYKKEVMSGERCPFWKGGPVINVCQQCGKEYEAPRYAKDTSKFCSRECTWKWASENTSGENSPHWKGGKLTISCDWCGNKYKRQKSQLATKNNFCCHDCYWKWLSENITGERHHNWNPNITNEERIMGRNYLEIKQWSQDVLKRDGYVCQACKKPRGNLEAHHLYSYKHYKTKRLELENGITLCREHHREFHSWMGGTKKRCTPQDFYNWISTVSI